MINMKLFVIPIFLFIGVNSSEYCKICRNHTLCRYPVPGPSQSCTGYNESALLTQDDIINIVSRINERRNFVAHGLSKRLPTSANMRKINWSEDLAWSAQRWVDQCDQAVHPDKHDLCRDLDDKAVAQNIATIFGPAPQLSVKSFVDIWFIQTLDYYGDVSFYNESQDTRTKYFTQLIWAETDSVGCGKARFYIKYKTVIERLVCNFAPSGNVHGKPVYATGIPATQCPDGCHSNGVYTGLCVCQPQSGFTTENPPVPSLLRILNFVNSSVKQDIDPIKNTLTHNNTEDDEKDDHRHHKSRHVANNSQVDFSPYLQRPPQWATFNDSRNLFYEKRQPRVYHGHNLKENFIPPYTASAEENFRRFDLPTQPPETHANENYRKYNLYDRCTRHSLICNSPAPCVVNKCTRGQNHNCGASMHCMSDLHRLHVYPHIQCPLCNSPATCPPPTPHKPCCEVTCRCPCHIASVSTCCPKIARAGLVTADDTRKSGEMHYYDLFPNFSLRSGDLISEKPQTKNAFTDRKVWLRKTAPFLKEKKKLQLKIKEIPISKTYEQVKNKFEPPYYMDAEQDYSYGSFDSRKRKNREPYRKTTENPFGKMIDYENGTPLILKSLHYTTLLNKKKKPWKFITTISGITVTESITIKLKKNDEHPEYIDHIEHSTEKYLSFDELMLLRKNKPSGFRRNNPATTNSIIATTPSTASTASTKTATPETIPSGYTTYPLFVRKKYCTRRLTCTWTAFTATASDGSIINPGINIGGGSRTPPGYVEGCTRTSTCTRDFMNRNKISTLPISTVLGQETLEDEDYCERRSLDVQRRNSNGEPLQIKRQALIESNNLTPQFKIASQTFPSKELKNNTFKSNRNKRNPYDNNMFRCNNYCGHKKDYINPLMSYGDIYYLVLNKLTKSYKMKTKSDFRCSCNSASRLKSCKNGISFLIIIHITLNKIA